MDIKRIIDDEHLSQTVKISALARKAGLHVERVLEDFGTIFGTIFGTGDRTLLDKRRRIDGVVAAVPEGRVELPPLSEKTPQ